MPLPLSATSLWSRRHGRQNMEDLKVESSIIDPYYWQLLSLISTKELFEVAESFGTNLDLANSLVTLPIMSAYFSTIIFTSNQHALHQIKDRRPKSIEELQEWVLEKSK